jgi:UDP-glucose:(heptosyl)LPS alpha-1,3-glucosyltransferase
MEVKRKIGVVIPKYGLMGGAEGFAAELTERIASNPRFEIHVFANRWVAASDRIIFHKVPIITFPKYLTTPSFAAFAHRKIAAEAANGPFDLIHAHDRIFSADVYTMHGIGHRYWIREVRRKRWMSLFDRATAKMEDHLIYQGGCRHFLAVSNLTKELFLNEYTIDPLLVSVIHPGINTAPFAMLNREHSRQEIRKRYGIASDEPLILFVSMNFAVKGLDHVLRGLARLRENRPDTRCTLLVVGRGDEKSYGRMAQDLGIRNKVVFAGAVARKDLPEVYLACDIYAMLSRFETFGMVVLEAMAAGLPVLISSHMGARDIVREGENGFIIAEPSDSAVVAARLKTMLCKEAHFQMGAAAARTAGEHSWETAAAKVINVYEEVWNKS